MPTPVPLFSLDRSASAHHPAGPHQPDPGSGWHSSAQVQGHWRPPPCHQLAQGRVHLPGPGPSDVHPGPGDAADQSSAGE